MLYEIIMGIIILILSIVITKQTMYLKRRIEERNAALYIHNSHKPDKNQEKVKQKVRKEKKGKKEEKRC
jgi:predicted Holliday junction resolvase-like endonuclease